MDVLRYAAGMTTFAVLLLELNVYPVIALAAALAAVDAVLVLRVATLRWGARSHDRATGRPGRILVEEAITTAFLVVTFVIFAAIDRAPPALLGVGWTTPSGGTPSVVEWAAALAFLASTLALDVGLTVHYVRTNMGLAAAN